MSDFNLSFMDRSRPVSERVQEFIEYNMKRGFKRDEDGTVRRSDCPYCQGRMFLKLEYAWVIDGDIPRDANPFDYAERDRYVSAQRLTENQVMLPCDCHSGIIGVGAGKKGEEITRSTKRFSDVFGQSIEHHWWGKALMEWRGNRTLDIPGGAEPPADHSPEAYDLEECPF